MKKILVISSVLLGVVFLSGCGQQQTSQTQPKIQAPVAQQPTTPTPKQPTPTTTSTQNYIEVKELGFKIPVDATMVGDLTYKINAVGGAAFSSKTLTTVDEACGDGASGPVIGRVNGTPSNPEGGNAEFFKAHISDTKQFNGFFLIYQDPQDSCTMGKDVDLERKVAQAVKNGFQNVSLIFQ